VDAIACCVTASATDANEAAATIVVIAKVILAWFILSKIVKWNSICQILQNNPYNYRRISRYIHVEQNLQNFYFNEFKGIQRGGLKRGF